MELYRVHPWVPGTAPHKLYGALYTPPHQGYGRWDNPNLYELGYFSLTAAGAVAEVFGSLAQWSGKMFNHPGHPDATKALSTYAMPEDTSFADLADTGTLVQLGVEKVTDVIKRDLDRTQGLAERIYRGSKWDGIQWWSYYDPNFSLVATWASDKLTYLGTQELTLNHADVDEAAGLIVRHIA